MKDTAFQKHLWLIGTVYQAGEKGITYEEINQKWKENMESQGKYYPLRTFHNHRKEIREVFNISISCNKSTNSYYIDQTKKENNLLRKILELITIQQLVKNKNLTANNLFIEKRGEGEYALPRLMMAIEKGQYVRIEYQPYWSEKILKYTQFAPYAVKEFKHQWYLLGKRGDLPLEFIDLKQVVSISILGNTFTPPHKSEYAAILAENYGGKIEAIPTEEITLKVDAPMAGYLRSNPLDASQQIIEQKRNYSIFYFYVKPTEEFKRNVLSFGAAVEVLSPESFKAEIYKEAKKIERKNG